ncbi:MAG: Stp1/IreP family PP2C-type Ser/Thr phosphatase [Acidobacteria bacterium]|nr:Stp1/IreP family PP2C-type Ser/Thr phosphatase [Acidobacteriota bacterium]
MRVRSGVELASLTDIGCIRENNEDSYIYWEPGRDDLFPQLGRLAAVADGMGGYQGGQIASRMAVEIVSNTYAGSTVTDPQDRLLGAFREAHHRIQECAGRSANLSGMGTTCTALVLIGNRLYFAHVGDSRLFLFRDGELELLTSDHTLVAHLLNIGAIQPGEAEHHPQRHVLTAALGVRDEIQPHFPREPLSVHSGDVLLLCTDGLWGQVEDAEIKAVIGSHSPASACRELVQLAMERGGPDNITLQVLRLN